MTHALRQRHSSSPWNNPLIVSLRYRCECAGGEVLQIQVVLDKDISDDQFVWTMKRLWHDVRFEVEQHVNQSAQPQERGRQEIERQEIERVEQRHALADLVAACELNGWINSDVRKARQALGLPV